MHNEIDITFEFEFGELDGRYMEVKVTCGDNFVVATPTTNKAKLKVKLPTQLQITFAGKIPQKDTRVDSNGNIVADMYVKIVGMRLDHLKVPDWIVQKKLSYVTEQGECINSAYIGFNGTMTFDIPENNVFSLYRRLNKDE